MQHFFNKKATHLANIDLDFGRINYMVAILSKNHNKTIIYQPNISDTHTHKLHICTSFTLEFLEYFRYILSKYIVVVIIDIVATDSHKE